MSEDRIIIAVDASVSDSGKPGTKVAGYGIFFGVEDSRNVGIEAKVEDVNEAEMAAAKMALKILEERGDSKKVKILTDSQYVVNNKNELKSSTVDFIVEKATTADSLFRIKEADKLAYNAWSK